MKVGCHNRFPRDWQLDFAVVVDHSSTFIKVPRLFSIIFFSVHLYSFVSLLHCVLFICMLKFHTGYLLFHILPFFPRFSVFFYYLLFIILSCKQQSLPCLPNYSCFLFLLSICSVHCYSFNFILNFKIVANANLIAFMLVCTSYFLSL